MEQFYPTRRRRSQYDGSLDDWRFVLEDPSPQHSTLDDWAELSHGGGPEPDEFHGGD